MKKLFALGVSLSLAISPLMGTYAENGEMATSQTTMIRTESGKTIDDLIAVARKFAACEVRTGIGSYTSFTEHEQIQMRENAKNYIRKLEKLKNKGYDSYDLEWWEGIIDSLFDGRGFI